MLHTFSKPYCHYDTIAIKERLSIRNELGGKFFTMSKRAI